ncbi:non-ribosomal peptide synthetase [Geminicoccus harenae]|uniref:non-ribosomal peptide synthetase n=4 Tax=Geminicoccus harenae TaxID=2498453 RepID=UPI001C94860E|nr:non-ribosomal peptide synthetase [Geminicoccus harenae]
MQDVGRPLTGAQEGLWFAQRLDPANPIFLTGQAIVIDGLLDRARFVAALDGAMQEADGLALRFADGPDGPRQWLDEAARPRPELVDLRHLPDPEAAWRAAVDADMATPVDLEAGGLVAQRLFVLSRERHVWYQRIHHLLVDGYGTDLLTRRVGQLYAGGGEPFGPFSAVLAEAAAYRGSEREAADHRFWLEMFGDRPDVAPMAQGPAVSGHRFHRVARPLDPVLAARLLARAEAAGVTWPDVLAALVAAYVQRHAGGPEAILGVPHMGRFGSAAANVPAMVMNVLPVRFAIDEEQGLDAFLAGAARALRQARRHGRYRSEQLRRDLGLLGGSRRLHGPLVNVLPFEAPLVLDGLETELIVLGTGPVDDLTFTFRGDPAGAGLRLELDSNPGLFDLAATEVQADRLACFLQNALAAERLADVPTLTPAEARHWLVEVNQTAHPVEDTTLTALIERQLAADPRAPAVRFGELVLDRGALDRQSGRLAGRLAAMGVGPGSVVAVALPRSLELIVALTAILRAGGAYLPLDLAQPKERLRRMLATAAPSLVLTFSDQHDRLPDGWPLLDLDRAEDGGEGATVRPPAPGDAAYVIFTSGSTGEPKGVVNEHAGIVNRLCWMQAHYRISPGDRILQKTPVTFDVSVWELFLPLISGAELVIAPPEAHKDPAWLVRIIKEQGVTTLHFVPSMLAAFLEEPACRGLRLRQVFCSGEELPAALRDRFHARMGAELHNLYGPTEAAVDVSYWPAGPEDRSSPVPIGFPVWNTALYVLDERMRPVPPGVAGHLHLGGRQIARGYLGRPDLTAERFGPDPFRPGERLYRTGDLARWRPDGACEFLGRSDHQVKIRGLRIELGEIEAALQACPEVGQAVVLARAGNDGEPVLAAYVTPAAGTVPEPATLRAELGRHLPDYMLPASFMVLASLPTNANGKLDRAALPAPELAPAAGRAAEGFAEERLARLFAEVLGREVGAEDDFFLAGGHSLLAVRLARRIRAEWGLEVGLGLVFEHPTIARLARQLELMAAAPDARSGNGLGPCIRLGADRGGELPPLFCIHPAGGIAWCYGGLARALGGSRPVFGLQADGLDPVAPLPASLDEMAETYLARIRPIRPDGPIHLLGWSVGGIVAQAIAARLGAEAGLLAMLDSYPCERWREEPPPAADAALKALLYIAGQDPERMAGLELTRDAVVGFLRDSGHALGGLDDRALDGVLRVVAANDRLVRGHWHRPFAGRLDHFRATEGNETRGLDPLAWRSHVGQLVVHDVRSVHGHMLTEPALGRIVPVLEARMAEVERVCLALPA